MIAQRLPEHYVGLLCDGILEPVPSDAPGLLAEVIELRHALRHDDPDQPVFAELGRLRRELAEARAELNKVRRVRIGRRTDCPD